MTPYILEAATAEAPFEYEQGRVKDLVGRWLRDRGARATVLLPTFDTHLVRKRRFAAPVEYLLGGRSFAERNAIYVKSAREIGARVVRACLERASVGPEAVDHFISTSCTGFMVPSLDAYLAHELGMKSTISRLPITEHGCAAGASALARAAEHIRAFPDHVVLVLSVEFCSLTFQRDDVSAENVISVGMFGDGAAAVLLSGERRAGRPRIVEAESRLFPGSVDLMGFRVTDGGFKIVLSREIPGAIKQHAVPAIAGFLDRHGVSTAAVDHWLLHPGGRKIVECFEDAFDLGRGGLAHSRRVLEQHGNLSSATVLFMLEDFFGRNLAKPGDVGLLAAFGPGFGAELLLLRW